MHLLNYKNDVAFKDIKYHCNALCTTHLWKLASFALTTNPNCQTSRVQKLRDYSGTVLVRESWDYLVFCFASFQEIASTIKSKMSKAFFSFSPSFPFLRLLPLHLYPPLFPFFYCFWNDSASLQNLKFTFSSTRQTPTHLSVFFQGPRINNKNRGSPKPHACAASLFLSVRRRGNFLICLSSSVGKRGQGDYSHAPFSYNHQFPESVLPGPRLGCHLSRGFQTEFPVRPRSPKFVCWQDIYDWDDDDYKNEYVDGTCTIWWQE